MGFFARLERIERETFALHPGEFWCEVFTGEHLSIDYAGGRPVLCVTGHRSGDDLMHWSRWERVDRDVMPPTFIQDLFARYPVVNCEFIGGRLIEVHLRGNPDFAHGNSEAVPVWEGQPTERQGWTFIPDPVDDEETYNFAWEAHRPYRTGILVR